MSLSVAIRHRFADFTLDVAFEAPTPGVVALFGPSGAGKTCVINAVAGLLAVAGRIALDGADLGATPPERRRIGLVFQEARLFPHLSVAGNLRYGLRRAPPGPTRFDDVVALLGIAALMARRPHALSGGERQRVAIGRALLAQPRLLLMDEPLASLDAARRGEILPYLARLKTVLAVPILYVTHAMDEVARLADTLVLLEAGRVVAAGPVAALAARADLPLALRDDAGAVLEAAVAGHDPARRLTRLAVGQDGILVPLRADPVGGRLRLRVPAREVILALSAPEGLSLHNVIPGRVRAIAEDAASHAALVEVEADEAVLLARVTPDAVARLGLAPGRRVVALFKSMSVEVLGATG